MKHIKLFEQIDNISEQTVNSWNEMYNTPTWKSLKSSINNLLEEGFNKDDIDTYLGGLFNFGGLTDDNL